MHAFDRRRDRRTEFSSLYCVCIPCSAVKMPFCNNAVIYRHAKRQILISSTWGHQCCVLHSSYYIHGPWVDEINFCHFACVTEWWALQIVIKRQFCTYIFAVCLSNLLRLPDVWRMPSYFAAVLFMIPSALSARWPSGAPSELCHRFSQSFHPPILKILP